jgi:imidazolonepropionase-like amidohydrolase
LQAVQTQVARHVDMLKIWVDDRDGQFEKMPPAIYKAIIDEAHKNKIPVAAHIFAMEDAKGLLKAGIDVFAHGIRDRDIDDETVELFKQHPDVFLIPNLPDRGVAVDMSWLKGSLPQAELDKIQAEVVDDPEAQKFHGIQARNMDKLYKAGVKTALGTDGSVLWEHHIELENMVLAGLTPAQAIVAATKTSAELLGLSDSGVLETDNIADFIVLEANPLDDITNTRKINAVYIRGEKIAR